MNFVVNSGASSTALSSVSNANAGKPFYNQAMSVHMDLGDYAELELVCPTWGTNPTQVKLSATLIIVAD